MRAQATLYIDLYKNGNLIAQVFYGVWVLPLGYLVFRSGFLPRFLGILLMIDCLAILTWFIQFLSPANQAIAYPCWVISALAVFTHVVASDHGGEESAESHDSTRLMLCPRCLALESWGERLDTLLDTY